MGLASGAASAIFGKPVLAEKTDGHRHGLLEMRSLAHARGLRTRSELADQYDALGVRRALRRLLAEREVQRIDERFGGRGNLQRPLRGWCALAKNLAWFAGDCDRSDRSCARYESEFSWVGLS